MMVEVKSKPLRDEVLKLATLTPDGSGSIVKHDGRRFYVNVIRNVVEEII